MRITNIPLRLPTFISVFVSIFAAQAQDKSCCEMKIAAAADAPARLTVTITNVSAQVVGIIRTRPDLDFGIIVKAASGREVDRTDSFKTALREPRGGSVLYQELKKGESFGQELDLGRTHDLKPGTYSVTLTHEVYVGGVKGGKKVFLESTAEIKIP